MTVWKLKLKSTKRNFPFPIKKTKELEDYCEQEHLLIFDIVFKSELELNDTVTIDFEL